MMQSLKSFCFHKVYRSEHTLWFNFELLPLLLSMDTVSVEGKGFVYHSSHEVLREKLTQ